MSEDEQLRAESLEIEHLLGEIQQLVTPPAWQRIERVLARVVRLYGAGLARSLVHARSAGVAPAFDELVAGDDLLASLLVLHGLHPLPVEERVGRAVVSARAELGIGADDLVLVSVQDGRVELQASSELGGGAMAARVAEAAIRRVIESVAPEITAVEFRGNRPARDPSLVQLRTHREVR
jgi:hypothetical protein